MTNQAEFNTDDFGVIAWREDGVWRASRLVNTRDLGSIMDQLKAQQGEGGSIALIAIDEEFFLIARCSGSTMQMMLSDVTDFGISAMDLEVMSDDLEMYPEEQITVLAGRLGFSDQFDQLYDRN